MQLMEILSNYWPMGNSPVSCKMVGSLQAVSIFVSTLSITAIALDRYQLIVYPTKRSFQLTGALLALGGIWAIGVILALPLFIVRTLNHVELNLRPPIPPSVPKSVDYCIEAWPSEKGRSLYSVGSILVQYALPIITVSVAHVRVLQQLITRSNKRLFAAKTYCIISHFQIRICYKLRFRMANMNQQQQQNRQLTSATTATSTAANKAADTRQAAREEQLRKTNVHTHFTNKFILISIN